MCGMQQLAAEGREGHGKARIRAVCPREALAVQAAERDVRAGGEGPCGRDCGSCEVAGPEAGAQPMKSADLPMLLEAGLRDLKPTGPDRPSIDQS